MHEWIDVEKEDILNKTKDEKKCKKRKTLS